MKYNNSEGKLENKDGIVNKDNAKHLGKYKNVMKQLSWYFVQLNK